ncbi:helix-turn-helix transcriptional regulator [Kibdelosporangium persicum]|uniref:DNA binding protein with helix-turn-helix domain n=1 Tax=Kibdelosporangium persicum TaxID=2698649 RepID=A0ABX2FA77_9PSEU|nr:helix-turn-helix transcriptional regulator [Kibdelosporangium persicum]NRN68273.1 DNA binding protein with helix-turn-helix domain [Kibdelosporangium persicum]
MPTARLSQDDRRRIGAELRELRDLAGRTLEDAAARLGCSPAKVSRIETGQVAVRPLDLRELLDMYEVSGARRTALLSVGQHGRQRWWKEYADLIYGGYDLYIGYEDEATEIWEYQPQWIPGLLQTHAYAQALGEAFGRPAEVAARWADLRQARQAMLLRENPPAVSVVVDDSALLRASAPGVMRDQLRQLVAAGGNPHVSVQVLPASAGMHPGQAGGFIVLGFADPNDPRVAYTNNLTEGHLIREPEHVAEYVSVFGRLRELALTPAESLDFIRRIV